MKTLSDEELNERVALLLGIRHIREDRGSFIIDAWLPKQYILLSVSVAGWEEFLVPLPDYCHDLNAMHEAEKVLTEWQDREYRALLVEITCYKEHRATARQRAEAFVSTMEGAK